jgi:hypothetical protein
VSIFGTNQTDDGRPTPGRSQRRAARYDRRRAKTDARDKAASRAGRDIGDIPPVVNARRRSRARHDFQRFAKTYLPNTFSMPWSDDHLKVIGKIEAAVLHGQLFAFAMPRGSGKTSLVEAAALWSVLFAHRDFVAVVGADENHARKMLDNVWIELETSDLLLADFPEVAVPIRKLERIHQRARGQLHNGQPTRIVRTASEIVLPTVAGSAASGAILRSVGITGGIRGMAAKRPDGKRFRPGLVLIDDPQTDEVAASPAQVTTRLDTLRGAILGLAGPGKTIAGLCTVTTIKPNDLADRLLDRDANPAWQGERAALVYEWPTAESLWQQYAELRREGQRTGAGTAEADAFYVANRDAMDAGARVAWPARFNPDERSALQHAYNLRLDRGEAAFQAEYQNSPVKPALEAAGMDRAALLARAINLPRGVMPTNHSTLTASVDVQEKLLFWLVASWGQGFSGHVVAYGTHPEQPQTVFDAAAAKNTLAMAHPGGGFEANLLAGLTAIVDQLLGRDWPREDGSTQRIELVAVDANWGRSTQTVREFCRRHRNASAILPAHGRSGGPMTRPMSEWRRKPGERVGPGWRVGMIGGQRGLNFDADHWKTWLAGRLATAVGDPGSITFHKGEHELLVEHLAAERPVSVQAKGRVADVWELLPGRDNHWLDAATMATVAASVAGIDATGAEVMTRRRRKVEIPRAGVRGRIEVRPMSR